MSEHREREAEGYDVMLEHAGEAIRRAEEAEAENTRLQERVEELEGAIRHHEKGRRTALRHWSGYDSDLWRALSANQEEQDA